MQTLQSKIAANINTLAALHAQCYIANTQQRALYSASTLYKKTEARCKKLNCNSSCAHACNIQHILEVNAAAMHATQCAVLQCTSAQMYAYLCNTACAQQCLQQAQLQQAIVLLAQQSITVHLQQRAQANTTRSKKAHISASSKAFCAQTNLELQAQLQAAQ